jgi:hypothetical protein
MNVFTKIGNFLSCLLHENCEYSIKKILTYTFSTLVIYLVIFTDKEYYDILIFVAGLLGFRMYERVKLWGGGSAEPPDEPIEPGLTDDSPLGATKPKKDNRQLLTD